LFAAIYQVYLDTKKSVSVFVKGSSLTEEEGFGGRRGKVISTATGGKAKIEREMECDTQKVKRASSPKHWRGFHLS